MRFFNTTAILLTCSSVKGWASDFETRKACIQDRITELETTMPDYGCVIFKMYAEYQGTGTWVSRTYECSGYYFKEFCARKSAKVTMRLKSHAGFNNWGYTGSAFSRSDFTLTMV